jgi:hypothetical protein
MNKVTIELNASIKFHYIYQDHFTVHDFGIIHLFPYQKEKITKIAMMKRMLHDSNQVHPTVEEVSSYRQKLYSLGWSSGINLESNRLVSNFSVTSILGSLVNDNTLDQSMIYFALDSFYRPWFKHKDFLQRDTVFEDERNFNLYRFEQIQANIVEKIFKEYKSFIPSHSPFIQDLRGDKEELSLLNKVDLEPMYDEWIEYPVEFYYVGPLRIEEVSSILNAYPYLKTPKKTVDLSHTPIPQGEFQSKSVQGDENQSYYRMIYTTGIERTSRQSYALRLLNHILGEDSESLLFQELRENNQFCYDVSSSYDANDGTITIKLGLHKGNLPKTVDIIGRIITQIQNGNISESLFLAHKQQLLDRHELSKDDVDFRYSVLLSEVILSLPYDEERVTNLYQSLTLDDVQEVALTMKPYRELRYLGTEK